MVLWLQRRLSLFLGHAELFGLEYNNVYNTQKVYLNVNNWLMLRGRQIFILLFSQLLYEFKILQNKKLKL